MILHALCQYYQRRQKEVDSALPAFGFEQKAIPFVIVIAGDGRFLQFEDTRYLDEAQGKKPQARLFTVAKSIKKTSGVAANLLWDPADYVLGIDKKGNPTRTEQQKACFIRRIQALAAFAPQDSGLQAVLAFYQRYDSLPQPELEQDPLWSEINDTNPLLTFRLVTDADCLVFQRPAVLAAYQHVLADSDEPAGRCLVSGERLPVATLHPSIKGVWGAQSSGASLVSFNLDAFRSFGKEQGANAPISEQAAFEYTTALNALLQTHSPNRLQLGETSVVCWASRAHPLESWLPTLFGNSHSDDPDSGVRTVTSLFNSVHNGAYCGADGDARFYLLGLSPNAARVAIRFFQEGTVAQFAERLREWFGDIDIIKPKAVTYPFPPLKALLRACALLNKEENLSPLLAGTTVRAILSGQPLPAALMTALLQRIRAERGDVSYYRASLMKACLNRAFRRQSIKEVSVSLDPEEQRIGYRLGRLFATLEQIQHTANPTINATLCDRYYSSASSTPVAVFHTLMRLHTHHLKKLKTPLQIHYQKCIGEIIDDITEFPAHLNQEQQGLFAIGYYHQRQHFFSQSTSSQGDEQ
ncbi:type I-C CRISPR-associated protein Cas8c/Csd1 [Dickeya dadantii]|uniref:type I-C CRISPR-associated protein Cas8c/Csd1 n=1 Tax=Dickeya dadantii TaxID=204038 RepID=UPI0014954398|nr:type I-C CRISPR-associated protein Cas8c/Csd1 [Dickeya dadantii]NPE54617.1 type I-C CRISPR-associated protein Cas8c/Csd1 [Dickeya dadantii]NPE67968.1 type I-C CRISPR-associated protein Cas8c/Csd1 [Dickeya dadantii]